MNVKESQHEKSSENKKNFII